MGKAANKVNGTYVYERLTGHDSCRKASGGYQVMATSMIYLKA
jgi:hypothetical protein